MKLTVEPVPYSCLKYTLHSHIRACEWDKLRKKVDKQQQKRCSICGRMRSKRKPLQVQEVWAYTDLSRHQQLTGLVGLCEWCHLTKNIETACQKQLRGDLDMHAVEAHFCRINACSPDVFRTHVAEALRRWKIRNRQKHWTTDLGEYTRLVEASRQPPAPEVLARLRHKKKRASLVKAAINHKTKVTGAVRRHKKKEQ